MRARKLFLNNIESEALNKEDELLKELESCRILPFDNYSTPEVAWEIKDWESDNYTTLGTNGNFTLVKGKAKSRKSFFTNLVMSKAIGETIFNNRLRCPLQKGESEVLYFDTEQSKHHVQSAVKRICSQSNTEESTILKTYGLRSKNIDRRLKLIEYSIRTTPNISFVVIDGIKDLVTSVNDERESSMVVSKLLEWTEKYNIHIIVVLHENPSSDKARGHLGTELVNKAETTITIELDRKDNDISIVSPFSCRNKSFEPFAFRIDDNGIPQIIEDYTVTKKASKKKVNLLDLSDDDKVIILKDAFKDESELGYGQLVEAIKSVVESKDIQGKGEKNIKKLITNSRTQNWLLQESTGQPYKLGFSSVQGHSAGDNISPCTSAPLHR